MPIIRCRLSKDGELIPTAVEFEPGDIIRFKSDEPVYLRGHSSTEVQVVRPFALNKMFANPKDGLVEIRPVEVGETAQYISSPPPPPPHIPSVTVWIQGQSTGQQQAGTAGAAG
jgi:hypothetical protein